MAVDLWKRKSKKDFCCSPGMPKYKSSCKETVLALYSSFCIPNDVYCIVDLYWNTVNPLQMLRKVNGGFQLK